MVAKIDLQQISQLYSEYQLITAAIENFDAGGVIMQMTVSGGPLNAPPPTGPMIQPPRMAVTLPTTTIAYPAAMVEAIKTALSGRIGEINSELAQLGVTDIAQAAVTAQAAPQPRARS